MRNPLFLTFAFILSLSLSFSACDSDNRSQAETEEPEVKIGNEDLENENRSLIEVMQSREDLSTFVNLVGNARMIETLEAVGPYTVFAPSNEAFNKLPSPRLEQLQGLNIQELKTVIGHHMVSRRLLEGDVRNGITVDMLGGPNLPLRMENGDIMIGDARVVVQSIPARNGVIHIIDSVLIPENIERTL